MKVIQCYVCEQCGITHPTQTDAEACEKSHEMELNIVEMKFEPTDLYDNDYGYPKRIRVEIEGKSGSMAEYVLEEQGSVEGFEPFYPEEYYD